MAVTFPVCTEFFFIQTIHKEFSLSIKYHQNLNICNRDSKNMVCIFMHCINIAIWQVVMVAVHIYRWKPSVLWIPLSGSRTSKRAGINTSQPQYKGYIFSFAIGFFSSRHRKNGHQNDYIHTQAEKTVKLLNTYIPHTATSQQGGCGVFNILLCKHCVSLWYVLCQSHQNN